MSKTYLIYKTNEEGKTWKISQTETGEVAYRDLGLAYEGDPSAHYELREYDEDAFANLSETYVVVATRGKKVQTTGGEDPLIAASIREEAYFDEVSKCHMDFLRAKKFFEYCLQEYMDTIARLRSHFREHEKECDGYGALELALHKGVDEKVSRLPSVGSGCPPFDEMIERRSICYRYTTCRECWTEFIWHHGNVADMDAALMKRGR